MKRIGYVAGLIFIVASQTIYADLRSIGARVGVSEIEAWQNQIPDKLVKIVNTEIGETSYDYIRKYPGKIEVPASQTNYTVDFIPWHSANWWILTKKRVGEYLDIYVCETNTAGQVTACTLEYSIQENQAQIFINDNLYRPVFLTNNVQLFIAPVGKLVSPKFCSGEKIVISKSGKYALILCERSTPRTV